MDLIRIFITDKEGIRRSHVKNLVTIAMADGHLDEEEWGLLMRIARHLGMEEEEIKNIKNGFEKVDFVPPKKYEDKVQQIRDLVAIMTIDRQINEKELELCKKAAIRLKLPPELVDEMISDNPKNEGYPTW
ncbi:MAG TPA: TerB family tellurite resistance protein [Ohtaekwangia sp.]|nr:TerB family tellurite resistance protein [Ohtaekwangia sp.]